MSAIAPRPTPAQSTAEDQIVYGAIHLDVTDADRAVRFWGGLIGLQTLSRSPEAISLGVEGHELLVLHPGAVGAPRRGHSGLYHLAIHLPSEAEFARVLLRIAQAGYPQAPTDHIMHWATYLDDPDGIGLELSFETLDRFGRYTNVGGRPAVIDNNGELRRPTDHLDLEEVVSHLQDQDLSRPLPGQTRIGHIHLHVGDLNDALEFYGDQIGFQSNNLESSVGMADMRAGGSFPHRLALNIWQGEGAPQRPAGTAGLRHFELQVRSQDALEQARERLAQDERFGLEEHADGLLARDPSGNALVLTAA